MIHFGAMWVAKTKGNRDELVRYFGIVGTHWGLAGMDSLYPASLIQRVALIDIATGTTAWSRPFDIDTVSAVQFLAECEAFGPMTHLARFATPAELRHAARLRVAMVKARLEWAEKQKGWADDT